MHGHCMVRLLISSCQWNLHTAHVSTDSFAGDAKINALARIDITDGREYFVLTRLRGMLREGVREGSSRPFDSLDGPSIATVKLARRVL